MPIPLTTIQRFSSLFWGRPDAYFDSVTTRAIRQPLSLELFRRHLTGTAQIGTYPVLADGRCRWGCIDIDEQAWEKATDVHSVWTYYGITSWIEASRSKGFHVWVFADAWVPAAVMRDAGRWVNHLAEEPSKEVNPKSPAPWLTRKGLVNTVRLPYPAQAAPQRQRCLEPGTARPLSLEAFTWAASGQRAALAALAPLASEWRAAERRRPAPPPESGRAMGSGGRADTQEAYQVLAGKRYVAMGERDTQFFTMANICHKTGQAYELALRTIERAWREQVPNKFDFPLEAALEKVRRVYGNR